MGPENRRMCLTFSFAFFYLFRLLNPFNSYGTFSPDLSQLLKHFLHDFKVIFLSIVNRNETFNKNNDVFSSSRS